MTEESKEAPVPEGFIRLISSDGYEFLVEEKYAVVSKVIKMMLNVDFMESRTRVIRFPEAEAVVLEKACQYLYYGPRSKTRLSLKQASKLKESRNMEPFDIPPEILLKLLLFASFLDL